jgi:signal transduction histidine kinase
MGLPVVREILTAHRAQITYTSAAGTGTTFTIEFPRDESAEGSVAEDKDP